MAMQAMILKVLLLQVALVLGREQCETGTTDGFHCQCNARLDDFKSGPSHSSHNTSSFPLPSLLNSSNGCRRLRVQEYTAQLTPSLFFPYPNPAF